MKSSLFDANLALVEEGHINSNNNQWVTIVSKGHSIKNINDLVKIITEADAPILAFVAFNHKKHVERCSAIFLLTYSSPELALETLPQIILSDPSDPVKLEAFSGLSRLIMSEIEGAFHLYTQLYPQVRPSIRQAALYDLVETVTSNSGQSYDVLMQVASFLCNLMVEGPTTDAFWSIQEINTGHFPITDFLDISDSIREALFEASTVRSERKNKKAALNTLSKIGV